MCICNTMHWSKHLDRFHKSEICQKPQSTNPRFTIGITRSREFACPCAVEPASEYCVKIPVLALAEIMASLSTAIRTKPHLSSNLKRCTCALHDKYPKFEKYLTKIPEDLIKLTACKRSLQPNTC